MLMQKLLASAGGEEKLFVDDCFACHTYTGNGSTQTINNGIDLAGKGGMVWTKIRSAGGYSHYLWDTKRGATKALVTNTTASEITKANGVTAFNSSGFSLGSDSDVNPSAQTGVSWTFRKAPKFFDVVTYTGNGTGTGRLLNHSLGVTPGMILVKKTSGGGAEDWYVWHRSAIGAGFLNLTNAWNTAVSWSSPTATQFYPLLNDNTYTYVAYLFAHDTSADGIIQCGSFTTDGSGNATVNLGWEPQWLMVKASSTTNSWQIADNMRGMAVTGSTAILFPNLSNAETTGSTFTPTATGFTASGGASTTYIYLAIRRPNKPPTTGTQVYNAIARTGTNAAATVTGVGFAPDLALSTARIKVTGLQYQWTDRLRGLVRLWSTTTGAESSDPTAITAFNMDGVNVGVDNGTYNTNESGTNYINHFFKRAPGVFSILCDTGTGSAHAIDHNLGSVPELIIRKGRSGATQWEVYFASLGNTKKLVLNSTAGEATDTTAWNSTTPTSTQITVGTGANVNTSSATYVTYLFATLPGISKVGSYTGNGSSQTINCGFSTGARFFMCKAVSTTGNWIVADSARGIVSANDPALYMNSTAAEVTSADWCDPDNLGIIVNQEGTMNANTNGVEYIYLAIA